MVSNFSSTLKQAALLRNSQTPVKQRRRKRKKVSYDRDWDSLYRETKHLFKLLGDEPNNINLRHKALMLILTLYQWETMAYTFLI